MMSNESGLVPLGRAVLVQPYEPELKSSSIVIPHSVADRTRMAEQRAVVVSVGPEAWKDEYSARAEPGDRVMISKFAGYEVIGPKDGLNYRVVNANDIFLRISTEVA